MLNAFFNAFHLPIVSVLPFGIDPLLVSGMGNIRYIITAFPPLGIILTGFLFVLSWKLLVVVVRMIPIIGKVFHSSA